MQNYRILAIMVRYGLPFRMRCGCSGRHPECERFRRIEQLTGRISPLAHWLGQYPWHTGRVSSLAHGQSQYPWHTGLVSTPGTLAGSVPWHTGPVSTPGTRAESVPLAHWPSQYPWHTGRVSAPGTLAESVPLAHGPGQCPTDNSRNMHSALLTGLQLPSPSGTADARTTTARAMRPPGQSVTAWCRPDYRPGRPARDGVSRRLSLGTHPPPWAGL